APQQHGGVLEQQVMILLPHVAERQYRGGAVEILDGELAPFRAVLPGDLSADRGDDARQLDLLIPELLQRRRVDLLEDAHLVAILLQRMAADEEAEDLLLAREPLRLRP